MKRALRNAALAYADRGWHVLPLHPRQKAPLGRLVPHGQKDATDHLPTVLRWWQNAPAANIGVSCHPSGLVVIDVDPRNGGDDALYALERELGELPETVSAETGGGGAHFLFRHPGGDLLGSLAEGVDVKDHGYIVAPPSIHPSGREYAWDLAPEDVPVTDLPAAWVERLRAPQLLRRPRSIIRAHHDDPLLNVPAVVYVPRLTGREAQRGGWVRCPFHGGGKEAEPSLKCDGTVWACYGCSPLPGKRAMGGTIYDLAGLIAGLPLPLRGTDFLDIQARLYRLLRVRPQGDAHSSTTPNPQPEVDACSTSAYP